MEKMKRVESESSQTPNEAMATGLIQEVLIGNGLNIQMAERVVEQLPPENTLRQVLSDMLKEQNNGRG